MAAIWFLCTSDQSRECNYHNLEEIQEQQKKNEINKNVQSVSVCLFAKYICIFNRGRGCRLDASNQLSWSTTKQKKKKLAGYHKN